MSNPNNNNKKKWFTLGAISMALLLIPRRSSQKADRKLSYDAENKVDNKLTKKEGSGLK